MNKDIYAPLLGTIFIFGLVFFLLLFAYEDGIPLYKLRCKLGWHKIHGKIGKLKVHKYYCKYCKKPRKHPVLKMVDGGNKIGNDKFKF